MNKSTKKLSLMALFAVICYVSFAYAKINIPLPAGSMISIHIANAIVVLCALLLDGKAGGLAGAVGLSIADILDPVYFVSAPKTFFLKFCIGLIAGTLAHRYFHLRELTDRKQISKACIVSASAALAFNVIASPLIGYFFDRFILGINDVSANLILAWSSSVTLFNAVVCVFVAWILYMLLYKSFNRFIKDIYA
ncbi:MAG: ECF transporter S component [Erysipelotrichaceae bacterium]|nr:ECF transporter S component [Erysipelotrichaceae bacterium]MDY5251828.1 ECF transporter S component [Erysipelotrichaceae bacterium]